MTEKTHAQDTWMLWSNITMLGNDMLTHMGTGDECTDVSLGKRKELFVYWTYRIQGAVTAAAPQKGNEQILVVKKDFADEPHSSL